MADDDPMANSTSHLVLNPLTPLAFLPTTIAEQTELGHYVIVGCLAVILWDVGVSSLNDQRLVKRRFTRITGVFLAARSTSIISLLYTSLVNTAEVRYCSVLQFIDVAIFIVNRALTTFLYLTRLNVAYQRNPRILGPFVALWVLVLGAACVLLTSLRGVRIGPTKYCSLQIKNESLLIIPPIVEAVYSTLISMAIVYKADCIFRNGETTRQSKRITLDMAGWDYFCNRFFQENQLYFVLTACIKALELIAIPLLYAIPSLKPYRFMLLYPDMVVMNILSANIYRSAKTGKDGASTPSTQTISSNMPRFGRMMPANSVSVPDAGPRNSTLIKVIPSRTVDDADDKGEVVDGKTHLPRLEYLNPSDDNL